ncbi:MAG: RNA polymerase sigma factor [Solirubrobacteraceae bacterium]
MSRTRRAVDRRPTRRNWEATPSCGFRASSDIEHNDRDPAIVAAVVRAQGGDRDAIRFLYLRYKDNVYGYVLSMLRNRDEAEDVTQHVFLKLISIVDRYEPQRVPFTAWIIRVARNVAVDYNRQCRMIPCEEVFPASTHAEDPRPERRRGLEQALGTLPKDQRDVIVMRHLVGLTPGEIARRMRRSEASVHGLHHRGRQAMQRELERIGCAPSTRLET